MHYFHHCLQPTSYHCLVTMQWPQSLVRQIRLMAKSFPKAPQLCFERIAERCGVPETLIIAGYLFKWKTGDGKQGDNGKLCSIIKVNMLIPYIHHPDRHLASGNWLKLPLADFKNALLIIAQMATEISRHVYPIFWLKRGLNCLISTMRTSDPYIELGILISL